MKVYMSATKCNLFYTTVLRRSLTKYKNRRHITLFSFTEATNAKHLIIHNIKGHSHQPRVFYKHHSDTYPERQFIKEGVSNYMHASSEQSLTFT